MKLTEIAIRCLVLIGYRRHMLWKGQRLGFRARPGPIEPTLAVRFLGREPSPLKYEFSDITSMFEFEIQFMFMFASLSCLSMYCKSLIYFFCITSMHIVHPVLCAPKFLYMLRLADSGSFAGHLSSIWTAQQCNM